MTFACIFGNCDRVFTRAYELKKHKATHENPDSVFHCSVCEFITLSKSSLAIHFAKHTGEKVHACPEMTMVGVPPREEQCEYRTNDPAALSKHRQRTHGYVPPANRSRTRTGATRSPSPRKPRQRKENVSPIRRAPSPRKPRSPRKINNPGTGADYAFALRPCADADADADPNAMDVEYFEEPDEEIEMDTSYDVTLHSQWMAEYEYGYSSFELTGIKYIPEQLRQVSAPVQAHVRTGREGCLCPDWMVEAGVEGWDASELEAHREYIVLDV